MKKNIIIFFLLFFLKKNDENKKKREGKSWRKFYRSDFIRKLIFSLFHFLGLSYFLKTDVSWSKTQTQVPEYPLVSTVLIREILLVMKFKETVCDGNAPESCTICLYDFEIEEEIKRLTNCKHIFHRSCLDHD
ncbi:hypothetical protein PVL29_012153 [Vitis rotundifolia]|uniref:RING-type domain-containing protein n=1 Tax=Vitis rotundifolia TaxID=103349 RepID=A0AA38ZR76_VITRO|nr:hypothetical protein PVL29_012153 [Vitis rotundifolia]